MDSDYLAHLDGLIETGHGHLVKNTLGIIIVAVVSTLFAFEYFMTMYFGIWHQTFGLAEALPPASAAAAIANSVIFSWLWIMMMWSYYATVTTKPGYLPKEKDKIQEEAIPNDSTFYDLIREREDIYAELVVKRKLKSGSITADMADEAY